MCLQSILHQKKEKDALQYMNYCPHLKRDQYDVEDINANEFASVDPEQTYWYYAGPDDEKTRPFCHEMLKISSDRLFGDNELNVLSSKLGYDVFTNEGGFNCRHIWRRATAKRKENQDRTATTNAIDRAAVKQPTGLADYL